MELGVGRFEVGDGQAQVTLRGGQRTVPQEVLDMAEIGVVLHQVRGALCRHTCGVTCFLILASLAWRLTMSPTEWGVDGIAAEREEQAIVRRPPAN